MLGQITKKLHSNIVAKRNISFASNAASKALERHIQGYQDQLKKTILSSAQGIQKALLKYHFIQERCVSPAEYPTTFRTVIPALPDGSTFVFNDALYNLFVPVTDRNGKKLNVKSPFQLRHHILEPEYLTGPKEQFDENISFENSQETEKYKKLVENTPYFVEMIIKIPRGVPVITNPDGDIVGLPNGTHLAFKSKPETVYADGSHVQILILSALPYAHLVQS